MGNLLLDASFLRKYADVIELANNPDDADLIALCRALADDMDADE